MFSILFYFFFVETLRKYPVSPILNRSCVKDHKIPDTDQIIEKGTFVFIPALALQMDEKIYDEPTKFKPERFIEKASAGQIYIPFGDGPRGCIGVRMGKMQIKVTLLLMLLKHKYELKSKREMEFDPKHFLLAPKYPVKMRIIKR